MMIAQGQVLNWGKVILLCSVFVKICSSTLEQDLKKMLLHNYDSTSRPVADVTKPLEIKMTMALHKVIDLDERNQMLVTNVWLRFAWYDYQLAWNVSDYGNLQEIRMPVDKIWKPDVVLYNDVREEERDNNRFLVIVNNTGDVTWLINVIYKSSCKLDVTNFPYDQQSCPLKFGSWSHHGFDLDLTNSSETGDASQFEDNGEWILVGIPQKRNVKHYACCPHPFVDLTFKIIIRRRSLYYTYHLVIPCLLLMFVTVMTFYLPPESGEKVSLGVTCLLAQVVFLLLVAELTPSQSEVIPLIARFLGASVSILTASTAITVVVTNVNFSGLHGTELPRWLKKLTLVWMSRFLFCRRRGLLLKTKVGPVVEKYTPIHTVQPIPNDQDSLSNHSKKERNGDLKTIDDSVSFPRVRSPMDPLALKEPKRSNKSEQLLQRIDENLRNFHNRHVEQEKRNRCIQEWQLVAIVIDRIFFILFLLTAIIIAIYMLTYSPEYDEE